MGLVRTFPLAEEQHSPQLTVNLQQYEEEIRRLLTLSDEQDYAVTVELVAGGNKMYCLHVVRYEGLLEPAGNKTRICLDEGALRRLSSEDLAKIRLQACNLLQDSDNIVDLAQNESEGVPTGVWDFPWEDRLSGLWLIFPHPDTPFDLRPLRITVRKDGEDVLNVGSDLARVMSTHGPEERLEALGQFLSNLAADFSAPGWNEVELWASQIGHLSLTAFDLWRGFVRSPAAMVALAFRLHSLVAADFVRKFGLELPFSWIMVNFADWKKAMAGLESQCAQYSEEVRQTVFQAQMTAVTDRIKADSPELPFMLGIAASCFQPDRQQEVQGLRLLIGPQAADNLFAGDSCEVQKFFQRHERDKNWPDAAVVQPLLRRAFQDRTLTRYFCPRNFAPALLQVVNLPVLLALHCVIGRAETWLQNPALFAAARECRALDGAWFAEAYNLTIARCLADGLLDLNCKEMHN